jgi:hypothetical protein
MLELCHQETPSPDCAFGKVATPLVSSYPKAWDNRWFIKGPQMVGSKMMINYQRKKEAHFFL